MFLYLLTLLPIPYIRLFARAFSLHACGFIILSPLSFVICIFYFERFFSLNWSIDLLSHSFEQCARLPARMLLHYNYEFDWMLCDLFVYHLSDWMCLFVVCFSIEPDSGFRFFNFYLCSALSILLNNHWIQIGTFGLVAPLYLFYPSFLYLTECMGLKGELINEKIIVNDV